MQQKSVAYARAEDDFPNRGKHLNFVAAPHQRCCNFTSPTPPSSSAGFVALSFEFFRMLS